MGVSRVELFVERAVGQVGQVRELLGKEVAVELSLDMSVSSAENWAL
jgi:hypothetical protein